MNRHYGMLQFSSASKESLNQIAQQLIPHQEAIIETWIATQWKNWQPPGLTREDLRQVFGDLFRRMLLCMDARQLDLCLEELEEAGRNLAERQFPFQALIISVHFLEESYLKILLNPRTEKTQHWLIAMDEFLHAVLAAVATSYFEAYRRDLLDQAEVGRIVQEGLLAEVPKRCGDLDIAHIYLSAREKAQLGGDFLDFVQMNEQTAAFIIGDLSGHGLEAASDSVMLRSLFRGFMRESQDLSNAMSRVNRVLSEELSDEQFATALAASYDFAGRLQLVSAGHPSPIICENGDCRSLEILGPALNIDKQAAYKATEAALAPGAVFAAFTDGLIEAGPAKDQFGEQRVAETIAAVYGSPARVIAERLIDCSQRHAGGKFTDDVAVLVIKRNQ